MRKALLRFGVSLIGRHPIPECRLSYVLHSAAKGQLVQGAKIVLRFGIASIRPDMEFSFFLPMGEFPG